ncbi:MAG: hypothetical protein JSS26_03615 [Nitrospira sp.]|nr:hypothetical protein [Nitrospira sp.]
MATYDEPEETSPEQFRVILAEWFSGRRTTGIRLIENMKPKNDPNGDDAVAYEISFEPDTLEKARVEVWATTDGLVAVGIEKRDRIAQRLHVKNRREGFAAGHEPSFVTQDGLLALLTIIADGNFSISSSSLPIWGLAKTRAVISPEASEALASRNYNAQWWLEVAPAFHPSDLRFNPW